MKQLGISLSAFCRESALYASYTAQDGRDYSRVHTEPILQNPAETINRLKFQQRISSARDRAASSLCIKRCSGQISLFLEELGFHFMYP